MNKTQLTVALLACASLSPLYGMEKQLSGIEQKIPITLETEDTTSCKGSYTKTSSCEEQQYWPEDENCSLAGVRKQHGKWFHLTSVRKWKRMFDELSTPGQGKIIHTLHDAKFIQHKYHEAGKKSSIESTARMMLSSGEENEKGFFLVPGKKRNGLLKVRLLSKINKLAKKVETDEDKAHLLMLMQLYTIVQKNEKTAGTKVLKCTRYAIIQRAKNRVAH